MIRYRALAEQSRRLTSRPILGAAAEPTETDAMSGTKRQRCAKWPNAGRSPAVCSTGRSPSTRRSARRRRASKRSRVGRGRADILVVPDLEAGNVLAKSLSFLMAAGLAGIVLGARAPITLTRRADTVEGRLAPCAVAALVAHHRQATAAKAG